MDIVVALLLLVGSGDRDLRQRAARLRLARGEGPAPGYFPFWVAVILARSSIVNLVRAMR